MPDIIKILPDSVANQIAAGEVIQRPASVIKELLENAIDAQATEIKVLVKDSGKTLIQVIDNGIGMSETDARICFERHATSKIKESKDIFSISTMGFRGEALASIAAIAQVELKSSRSDNELGTQIAIDGSKIISQDNCSCPKGTSIAVKNLFFNVPARRNFLKSEQVEFNHIIDEFQRVALAFPEISFTLFHNDKEIFSLFSSNTKQRITALLGKNFNEKLIPVEQSTAYIDISGFVCKPEFAKKRRGEQFFFVNKRFIKHNYLNHAVSTAFMELIPVSSFPGYFIYFKINPAFIDVNIHPTKTEIQFQDEKMIYAILLSSVKMSLGKFNITPSIDFEPENIMNLPHSFKNITPQPPKIKINPDYNPFINKPQNQQNFETLYKGINKELEQIPEKTQQIISSQWDNDINLISNKSLIQAENFIITSIKSGILLIDYCRAIERIFYEKFLNILDNKTFSAQQQLFPETFELSPADTIILKNINKDLAILGFDIEDFGKNSFIINGIPAGLKLDNIKSVIEGFIYEYKTGLTDNLKDSKIIIAKAMAKNINRKRKSQIQDEESRNLIDELFACKIPDVTPDGLKIYTILTYEELDNRLK